MINEIKITDPQTQELITYDFTDNHNQHAYFNAMFNDDLTLKQEFGEFAYWGAFRSSKSFSEQLATWLINVKNKNVRCLYIRDTYDQLKDSVIKQFVDDFDRFCQFRLVDREARFHNGSIVKFRTFEKDTNILSAEYDMICVCQLEDIPEELMLQLLGRLSGTRLGRPILLVEGNPSPNYVKRRYYDPPIEMLNEKGIFCIKQGKTMDNKKNIASGYIERLKENYPDWWFNRYVLSEWANYSDLVFSEFKDELVCDLVDIKDIATHWIKAQGMDYGFVNPTAILWAYKDYDGNICIWDEYYETKQLPEDIEVAAKRHAIHERKPIIADYSIKNIKTGNAHRPEKSLWDDFVESGLMMVESNKDEYRNILTVNMLMKSKTLRISKKCVNLLNEIKNYKWKQIKLGSPKNMPETPVDKDNHCFVSGTLIKTRRGDIPIEEVNHSDYVYTPIGYKKVLACGLSGVESVIEASFSDGRKLTATGDHKVYVKGKSLIAIDALLYYDTVETWRNYRLLTLMGGVIVGMASIISLLVGVKTVASIFMRKCGSFITGKGQRDTTYTIKTLIQETIESKISIASRLSTTYPYTQSEDTQQKKDTKNRQITWKAYGTSLKIGIPAKKAGNGTENTERSVGKINHQHLNMNVEFAGKDSIHEQRKRKAVLELVTLSLDAKAALMTLRDNVVSVINRIPLINIGQSKHVRPIATKLIQKKQKVYNLTVADCPMYFANGILVKNCIDALLYLCAYLSDGISAKDKDKEAAYKTSIEYHTVRRQLSGWKNNG